ncbi:hypothetical protein ES703_63576 [subsurface metagenome]
MKLDTQTSTQRKEALQEELRRIIAILVEKYQPEKMVLFGSLAAGRINEWTDIDLLIIKETEKRPLDRALEAYCLLGNYREPMDIIVYTPAEVELLLREGSFFVSEVLTEGKVLYEKANRAMA